MKGQGFSRRLGFALQGLKRAFVSERSFRTHLGAAAGVLLVLILTRPAPIWWAVLGLAVGIVLMAELFNSALETFIDHVHPEHHPEVGAAKDIAIQFVGVKTLTGVTGGPATADAAGVIVRLAATTLIASL